MKLTMPWTATEVHSNGIGSTIDEVRQALTKEVDHLANVATQLRRELGDQTSKVGHDAGAQATTTAQDASRNAGALGRQLLAGAAAIGPQLAMLGRGRMRDLGRNVQTLGKDLRHVRLTTEPKRTGPDLVPGICLLGGFGAGLALMYFLDPDRGRRRRVLLGDRLAKLTRFGRATAVDKATDFGNRTVGVMAEARRAVTTGIGIEPEPSELETSTYELTQEAASEGTRVPIG